MTKPRYQQTKEPIRLKATRGELGSSQENACPLYGPRKSVNHLAHAAYVRWYRHEISAMQASKVVWKLGAS